MGVATGQGGLPTTLVRHTLLTVGFCLFQIFRSRDPGHAFHASGYLTLRLPSQSHPIVLSMQAIQDRSYFSFRQVAKWVSQQVTGES